MWKWVAVTLAAMMVGAAPSYLSLYIGSFSHRDITQLRDRQELILQHMATIDQQISNLQEHDTTSLGDRTALHAEIDQLRQLIESRK